MAEQIAWFFVAGKLKVNQRYGQYEYLVSFKSLFVYLHD